MFESLTDRLGGIFDRLTRRGALTEAHVDEALREVRVALLEADVALPVVKDFIDKVRARAVGHEVMKSVAPGQQVIKIVHDTLVETLGEGEAINLRAAAPVPILMVGLQGSGKTTSTAKLGLWFTAKDKKKVLMASLDTRRPAAMEQLAQLGIQIGVATLRVVAGEPPVAIAKRAIQTGKLEGYDIVLLDTAGRLAIDQELMAEVAQVAKAVDPAETLLVADAMTGQDAVTIAREFREKVGVTGIMLTRIDGDARGGAALSMRAVAGCPIKLLGTGEQTDALEVFHPDRIADRILGMGDVVSLVEKAAETIEQDEAEALARKIQKGQFDLEDMLKQLRQLKKMGGLDGLLGMLPGIGKMKKQLDQANIDPNMLKRQEAIILSMTPKERRNPKILHASRKKRIAGGAGATVQDINKLLKQWMEMSKMMKRMGKMAKKGKMPGGMPPGFPPGGMPPGGLPPGFSPGGLPGR
ncbi:MAG TPA: signal recognition particle protein [Alphaproteobacteria bacterium]|nr:signal recognition particle protein [Alphaproteobacteria bacterium]